MKSALLILSILFLTASAKAEELQSIVVKPGETMWSISAVYLKNPAKWNKLLKYNKLPASDPSIALPGMTLKVPVNMLKEEYRAAKLIYCINEVMLRKNSAADWKAAVSGLDLFKNDTLRTTTDARADVRFYTGEILNLYPNSIAVLRPPSKKADVELLSGELRGIKSRVITATARITPRTRDTEFGARIKEDLTTLVQVYKGRAAVEGQGKVVEVPAGFATEVKLDSQPSKPVKLPPLPEFSVGSAAAMPKGSAPRLKLEGNMLSLEHKQQAPEGGQSTFAAEAKSLSAPKTADMKNMDAAEISKMISVANPVQSYHLQIARDQDFKVMALDKNYDSFDEIDLSSLLAPGQYWMRVSYIDLLGFEGKYNPARQIVVGKKH